MINIDRYQAMMIWYNKSPDKNRKINLPEKGKRETIIEYIKRKQINKM